MSLLKRKPKKINLYLDADDTILKSSETVIKILNKRYNLNKTYDDMKDWQYNSIYPKSDKKLVEEIYASREFFDMVEFDKRFVEFYNKNKKYFNFFIVTKGTEANLLRKEMKIRELMSDDTAFYGLNFVKGYDKGCIDMTDGIQVDDRTDSLLSTNAEIKILINHGKSLPWNQTPINADNFYITKNWDEISNILEFAYNN